MGGRLCWRGLVFVACAVIAAGALVACFDLLHSTSDIRTACEIDPQQDGCAPAARRRDAAADAVAPPGDPDFCTFSHDEARTHAEHACAFLGACEGPAGNRAFGRCAFRALLAFDCAANPNHPVRGAARATWACLLRAQTCADVDACLFPDAGEACGQPGAGDPCALWGQTCAGGTCGGDSVCDTGEQTECVDPALHWCVAGADGGVNDKGIDCASNGDGHCGGFPTSDAASWAACTPVSEGGSADRCDPQPTASCDGGRAIMCLTGTVESVDCEALLNSAEACSEGPLVPSFDWTSACTLAGAACPPDTCDGGTLTSCERGAPFQTDCAKDGLGACRLVTADLGARAACGPPERAESDP
jgi:hypothetical protein